MLDFLRKSATSFFAWLILGVLALVFGLSFGLPSDSLTFGAAPVVKVHGEKIGDDEYAAQQQLIKRTLGLPADERIQQMVGMKEEILEATIEREVLAFAAEDMGLSATARDAEDLTVNGHVIVLGETTGWLGKLDFNYEIFSENYLRSLRVSENKYLETQRKELLARTVRDVIGSSVAVSETELRKIYEQTSNKLSIRYARYEATEFGDYVVPTTEAVDAYLSANEESIRTRYDEQKEERFTGLAKQARLWLIQGERAKVEEAVARLKAGEKFRDVARDVSKHDTARSGGDFGWLDESSTQGLPEEVATAAKELAVDKLSDVLGGDDAAFVIKVTARREGDVAEDEALRELAEEAYRDEQAVVLARQAAEDDLAASQDGKPITEVFKSAALGDDAGSIEDAPTDGSAAETQPVTRPKVQLRETGLFSKGEPVPGLGLQTDLVAAAWDSDTDTPLLDQVYEIGGAVVLAGLDRKEEASDEGFAEAREDLYGRLVTQKANTVLAGWASRRCLEAKGTGEIVPSEEKIARIVVYDTKDGEKAKPVRPYQVCDRVGKKGAELKNALRFNIPR